MKKIDLNRHFQQVIAHLVWTLLPTPREAVVTFACCVCSASDNASGSGPCLPVLTGYSEKRRAIDAGRLAVASAKLNRFSLGLWSCGPVTRLGSVNKNRLAHFASADKQHITAFWQFRCCLPHYCGFVREAWLKDLSGEKCQSLWVMEGVQFTNHLHKLSTWFTLLDRTPPFTTDRLFPSGAAKASSPFIVACENEIIGKQSVARVVSKLHKAGWHTLEAD